MNDKLQWYRVSYVYTNPSGAGPFRGSMTSETKYDSGDIVWGIFGKAEVTACRKVAIK